MGKQSLDREIGNYWEKLSAEQRQATVRFVLSFNEEKKEISEDIINELNEPAAEYNVPWEIFKPLSKQQKKALIGFLQSSGIEPTGRISIEQYNKEIDEAMARIDAGEFYTQEQVEEMSKTWISGK